jgi:hypothetical protein
MIENDDTAFACTRRESDKSLHKLRFVIGVVQRNIG